MDGDGVPSEERLHQGVAGCLERVQHVLSHEILVLLSESLKHICEGYPSPTYRNLILDFSRVVCHNKGRLPLLRCLVVFIRLKVVLSLVQASPNLQELVQLGQHGLVGAVVDVALLVYQSQYSVWLTLERGRPAPGGNT